ncbi:protein kinase-like domain protein [Colletotrichum tofieldiae]|nr:protein kinase-like domain protein [Colletotrichum tofieldiae]
MLKTETKAPVPQIFAFELDDANSTGSAFVLLEYLPGNNAADEAHGYKKIDWGLIPLQHRHTFYRTMAAAHQFTRKGPFPIRHNDLFHSNVIVTKDYGVLGVIDWENSYAVPWELINAPWFLNTVPRLLNRPDQYDNAGRPLAKDEAGQWADEEAYADLVREAELDARTDHKLSQILSNRNSRAMAAIIHLFSQGKMGFYGRVLDYFEAK